MKYHFTFTESGKDVRGKPITSNATYHLSISAKTQATAEKKLRALYFKSVIITIVSVTTTEN